MSRMTLYLHILLCSWTEFDCVLTYVIYSVIIYVSTYSVCPLDDLGIYGA